MNKKDEKKDDEFRYKIVRRIGVVSTDTKDWTKEVNLISYNGKKSVVDIRRWSPNKRMSRGITFNKSDVKRLIMLLTKIDKEFDLKEEEE